jgi:hypothetical protein
MNLNRLAVTASVVTTVLWTAKAIAIGIAGGLGRSPAEGPLFFLGFLAFIAATVLTGMALARRRTRAGYALAAVVAVVVAVVYGALEGALISALQPRHPGWVWGELNLWVLMSTVLAVAVAHEVASTGRSDGAQPTFRSHHVTSKMQS